MWNPAKLILSRLHVKQMTGKSNHLYNSDITFIIFSVAFHLIFVQIIFGSV